jgi:manganese transport protein
MTNIGQSVDVRALAPGRNRLWAFVGPGVLVCVGYMDPGNWATDLQGGARFGYQLIWVLLASNLVAILLQSLSARLGIVSGYDLAQACRAHYPRPVAVALWTLAEVAIIACDLAEVLGSAVALNLLLGIPLVAGVLITAFDVLLILPLQHYGVRRLEAIIATLVFTVGACLALEIGLAAPDWDGVVVGFVPRLDSTSLFIAVGILGATVMPHNLYLHSALVQTRRIDTTLSATHEAIRFNLVDTVLTLNVAFLINAAILILSGATFFERGIEVTELREAYELLSPLLGTVVASGAFAVALLAAGQSSTITGTLAGQAVMEGFLRMRLRPAVRRLLTRGLAIVPAAAALAVYGEKSMLPLLIVSQIVLSLQLPFAMVPLIRFTSDRALLGTFANPWWIKLLAWIAACSITGLNAWLIARAMSDWGSRESVLASYSPILVAFAVGCGSLLAWIGVAPLRGVRSGLPS